jgi:hypothetical protein
MSFHEKAGDGADVVQPDLPSKPSHLNSPAPPLHHASSEKSLAPTYDQSTPAEEYDPTSQHPFSAFYSHPTTRTSLEQLKSESKDHLRVYEHDLEAGSRACSSTDVPRPSKGCGSTSTTKSGKKNLCVQRTKRWSPFRNLSKTQTLWVKILMAVLIIGVAVGIGIGISKAVGGGVWKDNNSRTDIAG